MAIRIREVLGALFTDEDFAAAFPDRGRPAISPGALAMVSVLQYAEGLSDRQAADQVRARMDWKFLLALELDDPGFDFTVLGDFRSRLIMHGLEERVLEAMLARLSEAGLLRAGGRQRTDSTHVLAGVRTLNRMEFVGETLRAALEALAAAAPDWLAPLISSAWAERYGNKVDNYRFPKGENVRREWAEQVGRDGFALLDAVDGPAAVGWLREVPAVRILRRAWAEQYHRDGRGVHWREGKDLPPARDRLSSPYDTDAHYGIKRGTGWCGYKVHLSETCEPDAPHLITNVETTNATVNDTEVTAAIHQHLAGRGLRPREHVVDAGYVTAAHISSRVGGGCRPVDGARRSALAANRHPLPSSAGASHPPRPEGLRWEICKTAPGSCHAARVSRARWETRVVPSGVPFSQASIRVRLRAVAERTLARRVLCWPQ
ncbi:transposase [Streptomyces sp. NPDC086033]|uniref:transposase n=1 Tax=Streptomyces sp. NPDC086033 TaxID=3365747 RepID=UPI0037D19AD9